MHISSERSQCEKVTYYCIIPTYITFCKRQNYRDCEKITGCQGLVVRENGWVGEPQRNFRSVKIVRMIL